MAVGKRVLPDHTRVRRERERGVCWGQSSGVGDPHGAGGWAQLERGRQPSAGQQRDSLDGGRDPALSWIPAREGTVPPARSKCGSWLGRSRSLDSLGGSHQTPASAWNVLPAAPVFMASGRRLVVPARISGQVGEQEAFLESAYEQRRQGGSPLKSQSYRRQNVHLHLLGCSAALRGVHKHPLAFSLSLGS